MPAASIGAVRTAPQSHPATDGGDWGTGGGGGGGGSSSRGWSDGYGDSYPSRPSPSPHRGNGPDALTVGLLAGGGIAAAGGIGTAGYAVFARHDLPARRERVVTATQELAQARQGAEHAEAALAADRVHPPAGTSAEDAAAWARARFEGGDALTGFTREGTGESAMIGRWGTATHSRAEALDAAQSLADGRGGGVVRAGDWFIPARFTKDFDAIEKSRQVAYTETVYEYHHGPNYSKPGHPWEYHYGPHEVTKYRTERYLDPFNRFRSAHDGLDVAFRDDLNEMRSIGTVPERNLEVANEGVDDATRALAKAESKVRFAESRAGMVRNVAIGAAVLGAAALTVGYLRSRD